MFGRYRLVLDGPFLEFFRIDLLTFQNYFVAGGKASSRMWGRFEMKNPPNPKGGPCAGKSIIYSFGRKNNLLSTIHINLNHFEDLELIYGKKSSYIGRPIWEIPIDTPINNRSLYNATNTHLGRLVPQTRILKIHTDRKRVLFGAGFYYPKFQDNNAFYPDIFASVVIDKDQERTSLSARKDKSIWRELHSIIVCKTSRVNGTRGPLWLQNINFEDYDIVTSAMLTNPSRAAEIVDLLESVYNIPIQLHNEFGLSTYEAEVRTAESIAGKLGRAIETYRLEIDGGWESRLKMAGPSKLQLKIRLRSIATTHYWTAVENNLDQLMTAIEAIGSDGFLESQKIWRSMLHTSAREAYELACAQDTPRQMRAYAKGLRKLASRQDGIGETETNNANMEEIE